MIRHIEHFTVSQPLGVWPIVVQWLTHDAADFLELIHLTGSGEEGLERVQLCHNATEGENINGIVVTPTSEDILWGTVPARTDIFSERRRVPDFLNKTKVTKLNGRLVLHENILWLHVSVEETMLVDVVEGDGNLFDYVTDFLVRERIVIELSHLHHPVEVHVQQLENDHQHLLVQEYLVATHDVCVLQPNHSFHFCIAHGRFPGRKLALEGLERHRSLCDVVANLVDDTEGALAENFENLEAID